MYERCRKTESSMPTRFRPPSASESCDWMSPWLGTTGVGSGVTSGVGSGGGSWVGSGVGSGGGGRRRGRGWGRGRALATEVVGPVPAVGASGTVDAGDAHHLEVGVQHVGVVPRRALPEAERALCRVGARGQVLALPGVVVIAEGGHTLERGAAQRIGVAEVVFYARCRAHP